MGSWMTVNMTERVHKDFRYNSAEGHSTSSALETHPYPVHAPQGGETEDASHCNRQSLGSTACSTEQRSSTMEGGL